MAATIVLIAVIALLVAFAVANRGLGPWALRKTIRGETPMGRFYQRIGMLPRPNEPPNRRRSLAWHVLVFGALTVLSVAIHKYAYTVIFVLFLVLIPLLQDPDDPRRWRWQRRDQ